MGKFIGRFQRTLDEKGRLQLPSKLVRELEESYYLLPGFEGCLSIYPPSSFSSLMERLYSLDYFQSDARAFMRKCLSQVEELKVDAHGRINIRKELADLYDLTHDVVLIGVLDHVELWDLERYQKYLTSGKSYEELAEELSKKEAKND